jgi:hypothetical protein
MTALDTVHSVTYTSVAAESISGYGANAPFPFTLKQVDNFIFIAPSYNTIYYHDVLHVTITATGQVTATITDVSFTCRP